MKLMKPKPARPPKKAPKLALPVKSPKRQKISALRSGYQNA